MDLKDVGLGSEDLTSPCGYRYCLLEYRETDTGEIGPFGLGASLLSLAVTAAFGISIGIFYKLRSKNVMKIRNRAKKLELEFAAALFQLCNRLGD